MTLTLRSLIMMTMGGSVRKRLPLSTSLLDLRARVGMRSRSFGKH